MDDLNSNRHLILAPPPKQIGGANVIIWTADLCLAPPTSRTTHRVAGNVLGPAAALAICQYENDSMFYLFYCNNDWTVRTDTCHLTLADAKIQAEYEYEGVTGLWQDLLN